MDLYWLLSEVNVVIFVVVSLLLRGFLVFCLFVLVQRVALGRVFVVFLLVLGLVFFTLFLLALVFSLFPCCLTAGVCIFVFSAGWFCFVICLRVWFSRACSPLPVLYFYTLSPFSSSVFVFWVSFRWIGFCLGLLFSRVGFFLTSAPVFARISFRIRTSGRDTILSFLRSFSHVVVNKMVAALGCYFLLYHILALAFVLSFGNNECCVRNSRCFTSFKGVV